MLTDVQRVLDEHKNHEKILLGEFNLHHPLWEGQNVRQTDPDSEALITVIEDFKISRMLATGAIT